MPPKKSGKKGSGRGKGKKGKGKGKKSGKNSVKSGKSDGKPESVVELSQEYYAIQIKDLEDRILKYQNKFDELDVSTGQVNQKYDQLYADRKDIVSYLKLQLDKRGDEIGELNDRLVGLQQAKESERDQYESQLAGLRTEFQETRDQLTSENMILGGKLASLEEFRVQREELMSNFAALQERLRQQEEEQKQTLYNLEKKQVLDKDRLKKEMLQRVNVVAAEFRKVSNKQMADTTKRTIRENVSINNQLQKMSEKTLELVSDNDRLREAEKQLRHHIDILETSEKELARKNISNVKILQMVLEKAKQQEGDLQSLQGKDTQYADAQAYVEEVIKELGKRDTIIARRDTSIKHLEDDMRKLQCCINDESTLREKLQNVLSDTAYSLKATMGDSEDQVDNTDADVQGRRNIMYEQLMVLLKSAANLGVSPEISDFYKVAVKLQTASSIAETDVVAERLKAIDGTNKVKPHYRLGDLGLVPRENENLSGDLGKSSIFDRNVNTTGKLNRLQGVLLRSVGTQTRGLVSPATKYPYTSWDEWIIH